MARPKKAPPAEAPEATTAITGVDAKAPPAEAPEGFTPVEYVFRRPWHEDNLYGTRITWSRPGAVQLVPDKVAAKMLVNHPDVYRLGSYSGEATPHAPTVQNGPDEDDRIEMEMTIRTMGKEALESYARAHFGMELDRRHALDSLRQQVLGLIDQFGAP